MQNSIWLRLTVIFIFYTLLRNEYGTVDTLDVCPILRRSSPVQQLSYSAWHVPSFIIGTRNIAHHYQISKLTSREESCFICSARINSFVLEQDYRGNVRVPTSHMVSSDTFHAPSAFIIGVDHQQPWLMPWESHYDEKHRIDSFAWYRALMLKDYPLAQYNVFHACLG